MKFHPFHFHPLLCIVCICMLCLIPWEANAAETAHTYRVPILTYSAIGNYNGKGTTELYVTDKNFKLQMDYLKRAGFTPITFDDLKHVQQFTKPVLIAFIGGNATVWKAFHHLHEMKKDGFHAKATLFMVVEQIGKDNSISKEQLQTMSESGIFSIQSNTFTNTDLTVTSNLPHELGDSKRELTEITGQDVNAIAYPFGKYDEHVVKEVKKYYQFGLTGSSGFVKETSDPYKLRRLRVDMYTTMALFKEFVHPRQK